MGIYLSCLRQKHELSGSSEKKNYISNMVKIFQNSKNCLNYFVYQNLVEKKEDKYFLRKQFCTQEKSRTKKKTRKSFGQFIEINHQQQCS